MDCQNLLPLIPDNLVEATYAYHVTNISSKQEKPTFTELKYSIAKDFVYDQILVNLPGVFFSVSKYGDGLPTITPYPSNAKDACHWRVKVPLNEFKDYEMYHCNNARQEQIRLIFVKDDEKHFIEGIPGIEKIDKTNNQWLCYRDGIWLTNDFKNEKTKYFVNFVVLKDFPLPSCLCPKEAECEHWDKVMRSSSGCGQPLNRHDFAIGLMKQWSSASKFQELQQKQSQTLDKMSSAVIKDGINVPGIGFCMFLEFMKISPSVTQQSFANFQSILETTKNNINFKPQNIVEYANLAVEYELNDLKKWCFEYFKKCYETNVNIDTSLLSIEAHAQLMKAMFTNNSSKMETD